MKNNLFKHTSQNIRFKTAVWGLLSGNFTWDPGDVQQELLLLRKISI